MSDEGDFSGGEVTGGETGGSNEVSETVETAPETVETEITESNTASTEEISEASSPVKSEISESSVGKPSEAVKTEIQESSSKSKEISASTDATKEALTETGKTQPFEATEAQNEALETKPNTAYFYSGLGVNGAEKAEMMAHEHGCVTLESKLSENGMVMPEYNPQDKASVAAWSGASEAYAARASGDVHVVVGDKMHDQSVFVQTEYPTLLANEKVSRIIAVDSKTMEESVVFDRANPESAKSLSVYKTETKEYVDENGQRQSMTTNYVRFE